MNQKLVELKELENIQKGVESQETPTDILLDDLDNIENGIIPENFVKDYKKFKKMKIQIEEMESQIKEKMLKIFEEHPDTIGKYIRSNGMKFTYKAGHERTLVDSKKLQEEYPDVYKKCKKISKVKSTVILDIEY